MQIIIIAGGVGNRMRPLVTPKFLIPFRGTSLLEYSLSDIARFKPTKVVVVSSPGALEAVEVIAKQFKAQVVVQPTPLGMADAIVQAKSTLDPESSVLILNASTLWDPLTFASIDKTIRTTPETILLTGQKIDTYRHGGYFVFTKGQVTAIVEKPDPDNLPSPYFKHVLDYFPKTAQLLSTLSVAHSDQDNIYEVALSQLIQSVPTQMVEISGYNSSLKHAPHVLDTMEEVLSHRLKPGIAPSANIASTAVVDGKVEIAGNVRIFDHATIKGPCYIGEGTVIGNGVLVRASCIEADCEIGYNTEVARSYIGPRTKCHTSYVGDSIIEGDANLAAGTITANLRFDNRTIMINLPSGRINSKRRKFGSILAKGVKTGIHASLMPGTVAEPNSIVNTEGTI